MSSVTPADEDYQFHFAPGYADRIARAAAEWASLESMINHTSGYASRARSVHYLTARVSPQPYLGAASADESAGVQPEAH